MSYRKLIAVGFASAMMFAAPALAETASPPSISVIGEASVSVPPDLATVDGGVTSEGKTAREASEANNVAMGKVLLALKSAGIDPKDLQTSRLSLQPQYVNQVRPGPSVLSGYRASNHVTVKVRDVARVASMIDIMVGAGANEIGGIDFMVEQASKLLDEARGQAIADARRKAEIYARAAGVALGAPLNIAEGGSPAPRPYRKMAADLAASAPVAQGEETLSVSINVVWAIKAP
ncbi:MULTISPECIES: SIMPL domain-containing protein [Rhodopseudomonas]|nr:MULTISPECIES: SIMPL domain-containing protein [Rhodopseudomonas]MDF3811645.1 SIMPL domain-containing protein [Rhodopseudomonas sp. BAL398]WOK20761.1 SIMPL domain-containing protein [Rhodopseudomonas sp. BAL398]